MGTSPTLHWTGEVGDVSVFRVWGSRAFVRDTSADKLSAHAIPCVFLGFPLTRLAGSFTTPHRAVSCPLRTSHHVEPVEVAVDSGAAGGGATRGAASRGAEPAGPGSGGTEPACTEPGVADSEVAEHEGAEPESTELGGFLSTRGPPGALSRREHLSPPQLREWFALRTRLRSGAAGAGGSAAGGTGAPGRGSNGAAGAGGAAGVGAGGTGAGAAGGTRAAGPGGARTGGTGAAGAVGATGVGAGDPGARATGGTRAAGPGGARTGGTGAAGASDAAGVGARDPGAGGTEAGGTSPRGAGAFVGSSGDTGWPRPYFVPLYQQVLGLSSSTGLTPPFLCTPPDQPQPPLQSASQLPAPPPYTEQIRSLTERREPVSRPASPVRAICTGRRVPRQRPPHVPSMHHMALHPSSVPQRVLQRFSFRYSSPQSTSLPTGHSLSAPPLDESIEPSGPYPELVGCLITSGMGLVLGGRGPVVLPRHADASWVNNLATQRSTEGYTFSLGFGSIYAGAMAAQELRWLTYLMTNLGERPRSSPQCGQLRLAYVATWANTNIFTKALQPCDHQPYFAFLDCLHDYDHLHYEKTNETDLRILGLAVAVRHTSPKEPTTVRQALSGPDSETLSGPDSEKWKAAMATEVAALRGTWKLVPRSSAKGRKNLSGKWVFRIKTLADGSIEKYKARWVVRGFEQTHMVDFDLTYAPVGRHTLVRILICIAAVKQRPLRQMDVGSAFLYAPVDAIIFAELSHAFEERDGAVCLLQKSLYGIKHEPRLWQQYLYTVLAELGFKQLPHDLGMYRKESRGKFILVVTYVDDLLCTGDDTELLNQFEADIKEKLEVTIIHNVTQLLGLNITQSATSIHLSAAKYAETLVKTFVVAPINLATPYRTPPPTHEPDTTPLSIDDHRLYQQQLGCLLFAAITCRPDLSYVASQLAQYLKRPEGENLLDLHRALKCFGAVKIANKPGFVNRTKHIALRYFFVKDEIDKGKVKLTYCPTGDMAADLFTKKLPR
ncbi:unnamed protein product [Closterium sp. NIES-53]